MCATLAGCGSDLLENFSFPLVVIDECTQATEPRCLLALRLARGAVVLVGDQQQLPPTCLSRWPLLHASPPLVACVAAPNCMRRRP